MSEEEARQLKTCPACGKPKNKGLIVCWHCFKHRDNSLKYSGLSFENWLNSIED